MNNDIPASEETIKDLKHRRQNQHGSGLWALLLIFTGTVFLLNNFEILPWNIWSFLVRFWPFLLILAGLQVLLGKNRFSNLVIFVIGLVLLSLIMIVSLSSVNPGFNKWLSDTISISIPQTTIYPNEF